MQQSSEELYIEEIVTFFEEVQLQRYLPRESLENLAVRLNLSVPSTKGMRAEHSHIYGIIE